MRAIVCGLLIVMSVDSVLAQEPSGLLVQNPLVAIRDALASVLDEAALPFTEAQVQQIALVMDEQRRATEELFGQVFNFSGGPPQGAQRDRALAGIAWMTEAFLDDVERVLTSAQSAAWLQARQEGGVPERVRLDADAPDAPAGGAGTSSQVAQIRINNNPYTVENRTFGNEIITRGGIGDFHGNTNFTFQNDHLNARNPFASNRPSYLQRNLDAGFNGPVIPRRLTISFLANQNHIRNVGTISAITPLGLVSEGIARPTLSRRLSGRGQLQVSEHQALHFSLSHNVNRQTNQGLGGITLRERARESEFSFSSARVRSLTQLTADTVLDISVTDNRRANENRGVTGGVAINVVEAFQAGGSTSQSEGTNRTIGVQSLLMRTGERLTIKVGLDLNRSRNFSRSENGFNGQFDFASLDDFLAGTPTTYTLSAGEPVLEFNQVEAAVFMQNDVRVSRRLTLMAGVRYQAQTNLDDKDDLDPRVGYAYAIDDKTVLRGGVGLFHNRLFSGLVQSLLLLDGTRRQQIVVRNPSYPNPFLSGETEVIPPSSIRLRAPTLEAQSELRSLVSLERRLPGNAQATLSYEINRSRNRFRSVNLNAPLPGQTVRPDPTLGNILELQSTGRETSRELDIRVQQRLRSMTVSGHYEWNHRMSDSQGAFSLPSNNHDLAADWARSNRSVHQFDGRINAQLPLGIFMAVGMRIRSGRPYTITTGRDDNGDTVSNDRPVGLPRNSGTGPGFHSVNVNLSKVFYLRSKIDASGRPVGGAGMQVHLFANVTNALNRSNLRNVSGALTSLRFGQPTSAHDPREIQIGARFQF